MKAGLSVGSVLVYDITVSENLLAKIPEGAPDTASCVIHPVLGTAPLIAHLEWASRQQVLPYLLPDEEAVGFEIQLKHSLPVPYEATVTIESIVLEVQQTRIITSVKAVYHQAVVAQGSFIQAIVAQNDFYERCEAPVIVKAEKQNHRYLPLALNTTILDDPYTLRSADGQCGFRLEPLAWESQFPCTPYDEWLMVNLSIITEQKAMNQSLPRVHSVKGPYLLRFEIEGIVTGLQSLYRHPQGRGHSGFQSDFLEPTLALALLKQEDGAIIFNVTLQPASQRHPDNLAKQSSLPFNESLTFTVDINRLPAWCQLIQSQLSLLQSAL